MNKQDFLSVIFDKKVSLDIPLWVVLLLVAIVFVWEIVKNFESVNLFWIKIITPIYKRYKIRVFEKTVTKYDIEGTVQKTMSRIKMEVPHENILPMSIEYVEDTEEESFIKENKIYVRVRPFYSSQEDNFLNVTSYYLDCVLIPKTRALLDKERIRGLVDYTIFKMVSGNEDLENKFHDDFFTEHKKIFPNLQMHFDNLMYIDKRGMLYSVVLRGLENAYRKVRFKNQSIDETFDSIIDHTRGFLTAYKRGKDLKDMWICNAPYTSYALLLIANPIKARYVSTRGYVKKAEEDLEKADVVFAVFSGNEWKRFGKKVAKSIESSEKIQLVETIYTNRDYRGKKKGIIKVYMKKKSD